MKKEINCYICGSKDIYDLLKIYYHCNNCQADWLKKIPNVSYGGEYYKGKSGFIGRIFQPVANLFYYLREGYIDHNTKKLWIDVGAGGGEFLKNVNADNKIGVEISTIGRKIMEKNGLKTIIPEKFLKNKNLEASVISFWHVLEHTTNPWNYLKVAHHNLSKNGKIIIGVPNIDSWEFKTFGKNWFHLVPEYHLWHFSAISMQKLLEKNGFKIEKIDWWSPEHHPTGLLQSFINQSSGTHNFLHKLIKRKTDIGKISSKAIFWTFFWLSLGLPIVLFIWIVNSLLKKSGTFVIVASKKL